MLCNFLLLNSDKTEALVLWPQAARRKLSDYIITPDGLSVTSCAAVKERKCDYGCRSLRVSCSCHVRESFYVTLASGLLIRDLALDPDFCHGTHMHTLTHSPWVNRGGLLLTSTSVMLTVVVPVKPPSCPSMSLA